MSSNQMLEGTWEEILTHGHEFSGHRVRLTVLDNEATHLDQHNPRHLDEALEGLIGTVSFEAPLDLARRSGDYFAEILLEKHQNVSGLISCPKCCVFEACLES